MLAGAPRVGALLELAQARDVPMDGVWVVGGVVRDALLGAEPTGIGGADIDLVVAGDGRSFARRLASATDGDVVAEHDFGTATVLVPLRQPFGVTRVDVASARTETYAAPGALPQVALGASVSQDAARRDVTVNAVAVALVAGSDGTHEVVDPCGGIADIAARRLRVLHDRSFVDDPTRIFRVARYAGRLGFTVDTATRDLVLAAVQEGALATISAQRLRTELDLVLTEPAWASLTLLGSWGVLDQLEPRLDAIFHPPLLIRALDDACDGDPGLNVRAGTLRLAALALGLGDDVEQWLRWLGYDGAVVAEVLDHVHVLRAVLERGTELRSMRNSELYVELGEPREESIALVALAMADDDVELVQRLVDFTQAARDARLTVRGDDVVAAGVPAGPRVGQILGALFLRTLDGELRSEDDERRALAELVARGDEGH